MELHDRFGVAGAAIGKVRAPTPAEGEPIGSRDLGEDCRGPVICPMKLRTPLRLFERNFKPAI